MSRLRPLVTKLMQELEASTLRRSLESLREQRRKLKEEEEMIGPDEYHDIVGRCPPTWHRSDDGKSCTQVRPGPKRFRMGDAEAAAKEAGREVPKDGDTAAVSKKKSKLNLPANPIVDEETVPPPKGMSPYNPSTTAIDKDGVTKAARVGLCGKCTAPPAKIPRLPNLTADEREAESRFADAFEKNADGLVEEYKKKLQSREIGDAPNVFSTDDAKLLSPDYNPGPDDPDAKKEAMGRYNAVVHQTANAIAKRAFLSTLDELAKLPEGDPKRSVLVTNGGVAAGKGYALGNVEETKSLAGKMGAIWDSAGEQNGTESPWVLEECRKRGLHATFVFVDSDPKETWENPKRGVIERAKKIGRMVDARVFADSYAIGAKNFKNFHEKHKDSKDASFVMLTSRGGPPRRVEEFPEEAAKLDADDLYEKSLKAIHAVENLPPAVKRGGTIGQRIWKE